MPATAGRPLYGPPVYLALYRSWPQVLDKVECPLSRCPPMHFSYLDLGRTLPHLAVSEHSSSSIWQGNGLCLNFVIRFQREKHPQVFSFGSHNRGPDRSGRESGRATVPQPHAAAQVARPPHMPQQCRTTPITRDCACTVQWIGRWPCVHACASLSMLHANARSQTMIRVTQRKREALLQNRKSSVRRACTCARKSQPSAYTTVATYRWFSCKMDPSSLSNQAGD